MYVDRLFSNKTIPLVRVDDPEGRIRYRRDTSTIPNHLEPAAIAADCDTIGLRQPRPLLAWDPTENRLPSGPGLYPSADKLAWPTFKEPTVEEEDWEYICSSERYKELESARKANEYDAKVKREKREEAERRDGKRTYTAKEMLQKLAETFDKELTPPREIKAEPTDEEEAEGEEEGNASLPRERSLSPALPSGMAKRPRFASPPPSRAALQSAADAAVSAILESSSSALERREADSTVDTPRTGQDTSERAMDSRPAKPPASTQSARPPPSKSSAPPAKMQSASQVVKPPWWPFSRDIWVDDMVQAPATSATHKPASARRPASETPARNIDGPAAASSTHQPASARPSRIVQSSSHPAPVTATPPVQKSTVVRASSDRTSTPVAATTASDPLAPRTASETKATLAPADKTSAGPTSASAQPSSTRAVNAPHDSLSKAPAAASTSLKPAETGVAQPSRHFRSDWASSAPSNGFSAHGPSTTSAGRPGPSTKRPITGSGSAAAPGSAQPPSMPADASTSNASLRTPREPPSPQPSKDNQAKNISTTAPAGHSNERPLPARDVEDDAARTARIARNRRESGLPPLSSHSTPVQATTIGSSKPTPKANETAPAPDRDSSRRPTDQTGLTKAASATAAAAVHTSESASTPASATNTAKMRNGSVPSVFEPPLPSNKPEVQPANAWQWARASFSTPSVPLSRLTSGPDQRSSGSFGTSAPSRAAPTSASASPLAFGASPSWAKSASPATPSTPQTSGPSRSSGFDKFASASPFGSLADKPLALPSPDKDQHDFEHPPADWEIDERGDTEPRPCPPPSDKEREAVHSPIWALDVSAKDYRGIPTTPHPSIPTVEYLGRSRRFRWRANREWGLVKHLATAYRECHKRWDSAKASKSAIEKENEERAQQLKLEAEKERLAEARRKEKEKELAEERAAAREKEAQRREERVKELRAYGADRHSFFEYDADKVAETAARLQKEAMKQVQRRAAMTPSQLADEDTRTAQLVQREEEQRRRDLAKLREREAARNAPEAYDREEAAFERVRAEEAAELQKEWDRVRREKADRRNAQARERRRLKKLEDEKKREEEGLPPSGKKKKSKESTPKSTGSKGSTPVPAKTASGDVATPVPAAGPSRSASSTNVPAASTPTPQTQPANSSGGKAPTVNPAPRAVSSSTGTTPAISATRPSATQPLSSNPQSSSANSTPANRLDGITRQPSGSSSSISLAQRPRAQPMYSLAGTPTTPRPGGTPVAPAAPPAQKPRCSCGRIH